MKKFTNTNEILSEIIELVTNTTEPKTTFAKASKDQSDKSFYVDKNVNNINHLSSETFYTKEYITQISALLGNHEDFLSLSDYNRKLIQLELDILSHDDYILKTYLHKSVHEARNLYKLFPISFGKFKTGWEKLLSIKISQRGYLHSFRYKYKLFYRKIVDILMEKNYEVDYLKDITDQELDIIFETYLTPGIVYDAFCVILLKTARDSLFSNSKNQFNDVGMSVLRHQVIYRIYRHMTLICISHVVAFKVTESKKEIALDSLMRSIRNFITHEYVMISITKEYKSFIDGVQSIFNCFTKSGLFSQVTKERVDSKDQIRFYFPVELSENLGRYTTTPRVYKPDTVNSDSISDYIIPTDFAKIEIAPSDTFIESLNISNGKRFSINSNFFHILIHLERMEYCPCNRPIPSRLELNETALKRDMYDTEFNMFSSHVVNLIQTEISKKNQLLSHSHQYRYLVNQTKTEAVAISEKERYSELYQGMSVERKGGITRLVLASILKNFPLYYTNTLCGTTRVFAKEYIISRHIGCLKLLRGEYTEKHVSYAGVVHTLEAYYSDDKDLLMKFKEYLLVKRSKRGLKEFYDRHRIDYASKEAVSHFMLLAVELNKIFKTGKTKLLLQYDQVASGLVFIAMLWQNIELGKRTNVIASETGQLEPYDYALSQFEEFYIKNIKDKNSKVLEFCTLNKKLHKYALMCYSYNQKSYGRTIDFVNLWVSKFETKPVKEEWLCLQEISFKYTDFINELFPGINSQFEILDEIVKLVVSNSGYLKIRTIDGAVVTWRFYKKKRYVRKSFNPHNLTPESYALHTGEIDNEGRPRIDERQYVVKFRSYLIHSIDAGVMRLIVKNMYTKYNYRCDQLHDCILLHPNHVDSFYQVVEDIYKSEPLINYMNSHVFAEFKSIISSDKFELFDELVKKFNKNQNPLFKVSGDFRKIYKAEV
jgi:hypothetical protein